MDKKYIVGLEPHQRRICLDLVNRSRTARRRRRAEILLKVDANGPGWTDGKVAAVLGCRIQSVERLRKRAVVEGFEVALFGKKRSQPPTARLLDEQTAVSLRSIWGGRPPTGRTRWTLQLLAQQLIESNVVDSISIETVRQALHRRNAYATESDREKHL